MSSYFNHTFCIIITLLIITYRLVLPAKEEKITLESISIKQSAHNDLTNLEKRFRLNLDSRQLGYFYYEVTISRNEGEWNYDSLFHVLIGFSNEKSDNSGMEFCKLSIISVILYFSYLTI